nr:MAG TPA: hypothetical protein [Caudoviricetes sp.]
MDCRSSNGKVLSTSSTSLLDRLARICSCSASRLRIASSCFALRSASARRSSSSRWRTRGSTYGVGAGCTVA